MLGFQGCSVFIRDIRFDFVLLNFWLSYILNIIHLSDICMSNIFSHSSYYFYSHDCILSVLEDVWVDKMLSLSVYLCVSVSYIEIN